jgi:hypothetical protein
MVIALDDPLWLAVLYLGRENTELYVKVQLQRRLLL